MSTTINWSTMTKLRRNAFIAEHVMGQHLHADFALDSETEIDVAIRIEGSDGVIRIEPLPDYVESMDAAWLIVEKLETSATLTYTRPFAPGYPEGRAAHYECKIIELDPICGNDRIARAIANTPAEAICIAALRWVGIQVTDTIEAIPCWQLTYEDGQKMIFRDKQQAERELASREQYLKDNLQWAKNVRKLKIEEVQVPEDYFNGPVIG